MIEMNKLTSDVSNQTDGGDNNYLKTFKCPQCSDCFRYRRHYDKHLEGHKQNNCKYCGKLFTVRKKLALHLLDVHKITLKVTKHCCQYCDRTFAKKVSLYQHYQLHAPGKHVCLYCGMFFSEYKEYAKHQEKHKYEKPYKCEKCDEKFSRRQQYLLHVKDHEKYKCLTCKENFSAHFKLTEHKKKGHEIKELKASYVCEKCHRSFRLQRALVLHQRVHRGEKSFNCTECGKDFSSKKSYSKHLNSYKHGEKKIKCTETFEAFICDICGKICKEKRSLSLHLTRVHCKEEPMKCSFCDYKTTSKANLKRHVEFHTEERKFICECCGASFYMLCTLKEHCLYVHSEERNFQCTECGKSFKRKCGLNRHMQNHSESRPYECHCGQTYKRMSHLKRHKESSHGLVYQHNNLRRLRCDSSGVLVPVIEKGVSALRKRTPRNLKTISKLITKNDGESKTELQEKSCESCSAEEAKLVVTGIQGGESISCSSICNMNLELNINGSATISEQCDELRLGKERLSVNCLLPGNGLLSCRASRRISQFENVVSSTVNLLQSTPSNMPCNSSSAEKSDCEQNTCPIVEDISHDQVVSDSPHTELVPLIQESPSGIRVIDLVQMVAPGNVLVDESMVFLCLASLPVTASGDCL